MQEIHQIPTNRLSHEILLFLSFTPIMRVFILSTGRSGSLSFARACGEISNYTVGHESRSRRLGEARLDYPDGHIEADNRLAWFTGALDRRFGNEAFYVHLIRERKEVVESYNRRWVRYGSLIRAYCEGIHQITIHTLDPERRLEVVEDFYDRVNENISLFLKDKEKVLTMHLEQIQEEFPRFWDAIGAEGDLDRALGILETRHNRSKTGPFKQFKHEAKYQLMRFWRRIF